MGRLGALFRPTCTSYAGCAQWDNNPLGTISPISISRHHAAKTSPSGGSGALAPIGAHFLALQARLYGFPRPQGRFACFSPGDSPIVKVLYKLAAQPLTTTLSGEAAVKL